LQDDNADKCIDAEIMNALTQNIEFNNESEIAQHRYVDKHKENGETFQSSYTYITDDKSKPIAILNIPYLEKDDFLAKELQEFLQRIGFAFILVLSHEIKNPLTPMRLTVQNFQRKFDPTDDNIHSKVDEYSKTLIQQIDTMSSIASAFSNFAKMPAQQNETLNVVKIVKLALDIFNEDYIVFTSDSEEIIAKFDRTQLIRVVTNLVKNAIQAISSDKIPKIVINVGYRNGDVIITVADNGSGIEEENRNRVFEPKFTTKTSGMGLGLAMVKNIVETYKGNISFVSEKDMGTTFKVIFPEG